MGIGGAPSKYKKKYNKLMLEFFDRAATTFRTVEKSCKTGPYTISEECGNKFPTFERFAITIGVHRETMINWCDKHKEFFDTYKKCKDIQKDILIQNGLLGFYDKTFAIFTAKNCTDMKDKQEIENTGNSPISITFVEKEKGR